MGIFARREARTFKGAAIIMSDSFHSADIEPAVDRVSHCLIIDGLPVARFNDLRKALDARRLGVEQAIEQRGRSSKVHGDMDLRRIDPSAAEVLRS